MCFTEWEDWTTIMKQWQSDSEEVIRWDWFDQLQESLIQLKRRGIALVRHQLEKKNT